MTKRDLGAWLAVCILTTLWVLPKFQNHFVYDDVQVVFGALIHNPARIFEVFISHTLVAHDNQPASLPMDTYRPIALLSFFWDAALSGHDPWSYHLTNHVIHLGVVAALFLLARSFLPTAGVLSIALSCAFFALSPQLAEGHVWINGRSDPLAALFGLLAIWMWRRSASSSLRKRWLVAACITLLLGLLCKEVLLLGLLSLVLVPSLAGSSLAVRVKSLLPLAGTAACYLAMRLAALNGMRAVGIPGQLRRAVENLPILWFDGLRELLAPSRLYLRNLRDEYELVGVPERLGLALLALAICAVLWRVRARAPVLTWGAAWFVTTLSPAAMISAVLWPGFGRYLYLPCAGLALGLAELLDKGQTALERRRAVDPRGAQRLERLSLAVAGVYLLSLGVRLTLVTEDFENNQTLYLRAIRSSPTPAYAYAWLGSSEQHEGRSERAVALLTRAVELDGTESAYLHDLARSHLLANHLTQAITLARDGIKRSPPGAAGNLRLILIQALAGPAPEEAVAELCLCLTERPDQAECARAPAWMLDPRGPNASRFREALLDFAATCPSRAAQAVVSRHLTHGAERRAE